MGWKSNARRAFAPETLEVAVAGPGVREVPFEVGSEGERQWAMATTTDGEKRGNRRVWLLIEIGTWAGADDETRANLLRDAVVRGRRILGERCKLRLEFEPLPA